MKTGKTNKKGTILMVIGLMLVAAALLLTFYNLWDERRAAEETADALMKLDAEMQATSEEEENVPDYVRYPDMEMPTIEINGNTYIGELSIPVLDLRLPILSEWSESLLGVSPCRYRGSVYRKDMIIAGHNYRCHFGAFGSLSIGDEVQFTDVEKHVFNYEIEDIEVIDGADVERMQEGDWDLTLFTCTYGGKTRLTIRCIQTDVQN